MIWTKTNLPVQETKQNKKPPHNVHQWITLQKGDREQMLGQGGGCVCLLCIHPESSLICQVHVKKSLSEFSLEMLCQVALGTREDAIK